MILNFGKADIELLSSYLHDAAFAWEDVQFDSEARSLKIKVNRPCHESPQHGRAFGVIPVVRFQTVPALLTVSSVHAVSTTMRHRHAQAASYTHSLIDIELEGDTLVLDSDGATMRADLEAFVPIELKDVGPRSAETKLEDMFEKVSRFDEMAKEFERLRSDA